MIDEFAKLFEVNVEEEEQRHKLSGHTFFILEGNKTKEVSYREYELWKERTPDHTLLMSHEFENCADTLTLEFMGGDHSRVRDERLFQLKYFCITDDSEWTDNWIEENYETYDMAVERFKDYVKNGRATTVVLKKRMHLGMTNGSKE